VPPWVPSEKELSLTFDVLPPQSVSLAGTVTAATSIAVATFPTLPYASPGAPYLATLIGSGGSGSYSWQVAAGSVLPSGLSLSAAGGLTGTVASSVAVGNHSFSVQLTDSASHTTTAQLTLPVALASTQANCNDMEYPNSSTPNVHSPILVRALTWEKKVGSIPMEAMCGHPARMLRA